MRGRLKTLFAGVQMFCGISLLVLLHLALASPDSSDATNSLFDLPGSIWDLITGHSHGSSEKLDKVFFDIRYTLVKNQSQLWRFEVGADWSEGFNLGTSHICLLSSHSKFVRVRDGKSIKNDYYSCKKDERLKVAFKNGYMFLQPFDDGGYIACAEDGGMRVVRERCMDARFLGYLKEDNQLVLFSPTHERYVTAKESGGVHCGKLHYLEDEHFRGWKRGSKDVWTPKERWYFIAGLDNTQSSQITAFRYKKIVGIQRSETKEQSMVAGKSSISVRGFRSFFMVGIKASIAAYQWRTITTESWFSSRTFEATTKVLGGTRIEIYQLVGLCGPFTIRSTYFQIREKDHVEFEVT